MRERLEPGLATTAAPRLASAAAVAQGRGTESEAVIMADRVTGPASYFPSIEKTYGRPVEEWFALIEASPLSRHGELVSWLKAEHGLGHGHANALVAHVLKR
ncbi:MAG: DUF4287 domain-containing protein [Mycetocola reblochoni]